MVSLPIPDYDSPYSYDSLPSPIQEFSSIGEIVEQLTKGKIRGTAGAHVDPDLNRSSHGNRDPSWRPLYGQQDAAQGHLENQGVRSGDLFLFYSWLRRVEILENGTLRFSRSDQTGIHAIVGWLEIESVLPAAIARDRQKWVGYHPHFYATAKRGNNTIYASRAMSETMPGVPGAGSFAKFDQRLQLTAIDASSHTVWSLPKWFDPTRTYEPLSYHSVSTRWTVRDDDVLLQTVSRGQEFVLDCAVYPEAIPWASSLLKETFALYGSAG